MDIIKDFKGFKLYASLMKDFKNEDFAYNVIKQYADALPDSKKDFISDMFFEDSILNIRFESGGVFTVDMPC
jgi:hypothetical protein